MQDYRRVKLQQKVVFFNLECCFNFSYGCIFSGNVDDFGFFVEDGNATIFFFFFSNLFLAQKKIINLMKTAFDEGTLCLQNCQIQLYF